MKKLSDKTSLITGASSGIGQSCAYALAEEGSNLILAARRSERLHQIARELENKYHISVLVKTVDVRKKEDVFKMVDSLTEEWQAIDILINNAGLARGIEKIPEADIDNWETMIDTNVKGLLYMTRAVVPGMIRRNRGHIVNIGSIAGHEVYPGGNVYCATKHAVDAITKGLRIDLVNTAIRVSTVDPGLVETEFSIVRFDGDKEKAKNVYKGMRPLTGQDIADIVTFIVTRPSHVQIAEAIVFPTNQAAATIVHREE
ncbi:MAG TPA: SDR family oxidoreductase [Caldithrix abyssi]|uniref:SDR family oxidoreductase n=1 Tax=Caldithrix abyssi TaxID=187145 RepID=A0A7V4U1F7_CALAY|nr:SDR family oxidoreductase [Caldithrix abyssi]